MKNGFNKVQKNISIWETACRYWNFHRITHISHNLIIFRRYPWNIFETKICGIFFEYSGNIALWSLEFVKGSTFVIVKSYIFNTKTIFHLEIFKNHSPLKCSLNVSGMSRTWQNWGNTQGILDSNNRGYRQQLNRWRRMTLNKVLVTDWFKNFKKKEKNKKNVYIQTIYIEFFS